MVKGPKCSNSYDEWRMIIIIMMDEYLKHVIIIETLDRSQAVSDQQPRPAILSGPNAAM